MDHSQKLKLPGGTKYPREFPFLLALFFTQDHFAVADELVVEPQPVLICGCFAAGTWRTAQEPHAGGRLKHVRGKGTAIRVEFDAQVAGIGDPGNLVAFVQHHNLRNKSNEYRALGHFCLWPRRFSGADAPD